MRIKERRRALPFQGARKRPSKQQRNTGESTLQLYIYFVPFHPGFSKVWSRLLFLGRFSSQSYTKTFSFLLRNGLEAPGQQFTAVRYKRCDSELLPISSQECLLRWRKWNVLLLRWFPASSPLPLPASRLWSQEVKITAAALLWPSAFSHSGQRVLLAPSAALAAPASCPQPPSAPSHPRTRGQAGRATATLQAGRDGEAPDLFSSERVPQDSEGHSGCPETSIQNPACAQLHFKATGWKWLLLLINQIIPKTHKWWWRCLTDIKQVKSGFFSRNHRHALRRLKASHI